MTSSAQKPHRHLLHLQTPYTAISAPPPTPSAHSNSPSDTTTTADALSHLLQRLPPTLSIATRRRSSATTPPLISLSDPTQALLSAATQLGFFHLTHNRHLPSVAESAAAASLFNLPDHQKTALFSNAWPLGYDDDVSDGESFCLDPWAGPPDEVSGLDWASLREFGLEMEKLGLKVVEELASAVGFKNPAPDELCSLLWISDETDKPGRVYPYVVGLHCQVKPGKYSLLSDSGWVDMSEREDSVLVTVGDIAQVWSNGKLKKVRGRPMPSSGEDSNKSHRITLSLLISFTVESTVSPLLPGLDHEEEIDDFITKDVGEMRQFRSFSFER